MTARFTRHEKLLVFAAYVLLVAGLAVVPRLVPGTSTGVSAAAVDGYNNSAAFWTVVGLSLLTIAAFGWRRRALRTAAGQPLAPPAEAGLRQHAPATAHAGWLELAAVFVLFALAYWPPFLARYAPFSEDIYFLTALGRMECGQVPYRDFGFLYGPSMIYVLWGWSKLFGVGLLSYYSFLALLQGLQFAVLMWVLQRLVPERRQRFLVFLLLLPFLYNNLFGLNYDGTRWLVPALAVLLASLRPHDRVATAWCALLLGLHLTYSHEYAIAALAAIVGMHAVAFWQGQRSESLRAALVIAVGSVAVWAVVATLLLGGTVPDYVHHAREIVGMMSSGHAGFRFYWTANSLALFGLLTMGCAIVGTRLAAGRRDTMGGSERLLLGAVLFALVSLRSGLTRADLWHLNPNFLPLLFAFVLPFSARTLLPDRRMRRIGTGLVTVAAVTFLVGIAPMASLHATSYLRGMVDTLSGAPAGSRAAIMLERGIERERSHPDEQLVALGAYLQSAERRQRPVLFYGRSWALSSRIGICPAHYKLDDLMYTEFTRPEAAYLEAHPDALVVIGRDEFSRLSGLVDEVAPHSSLVLTPAKQVGRWLSTVHYDSAETEARLQNEARAQLTGRYVLSAYEPAAVFGGYVVLARR